MLNQMEKAVRVTGMDLSKLTTPNAALAQRLYQSAQLPRYDEGQWQHGRITTANAELFGSAFMSEPMTNYAVGWSDPEGYDALVEFIAPSFQAPGELFQFREFDNSEEFLSDGSYDDLRAIKADFKTVDYTETLVTGKVANRGLRMEVDYDYVKNDPMWQQRYTGKLLARLKRNQARRAFALSVAASTSDALTFSTSASGPDEQLLAAIIASGTNSGIPPNRMLMGLTAWQYRRDAYANATTGTNQFAAAAALNRTFEELCTLLKVDGKMDAARFQSGTTKSELIGPNILIFNGKSGVDQEDPSNFKLAWVNCQNGQRFAVYIRQLSVKKWEIVVEHYEYLFCAAAFGAMYLPITGS
jgi:hypothetical protein